MLYIPFLSGIFVMETKMFRLKKQFAQTIIREVGPVLPNDINIMNEKGIIIASTNPERINQFHEAAFKIITEKLNELNVFYEGEYEGCHKGINLPILFQNELIGVIGMTGDVEEISKYGQILKKMTEVMTRDLFLESKRSLREREKAIFLHDLLRGRAKGSTLKQQLDTFGLNYDGPFRVFIFNPTEIGENISFPNTISYTVQDRGVGLSNEPLDALISYFETITEKNSAASFYIGSSCNSISDIPKSNATSKLLYNYLSKRESKRIESFDDHFVEISLWQGGDELNSHFIDDLFGQASQKTIEEAIELIDVYEKCNGSISAMADEMHLHKNTVQYRINKIKDITGRDIRQYGDFFYLKIASTIYK